MKEFARRHHVGVRVHDRCMYLLTWFKDIPVPCRTLSLTCAMLLKSVREGGERDE